MKLLGVLFRVLWAQMGLTIRGWFAPRTPTQPAENCPVGDPYIPPPPKMPEGLSPYRNPAPLPPREYTWQRPPVEGETDEGACPICGALPGVKCDAGLHS